MRLGPVSLVGARRWDVVRRWLGAQGERGDTVVRGANNTHAGYDGNVYRQNDRGGWEKSTGSGWSSADRGSMGSQQQQRLNSQSQARITGQMRTSNHDSGSFRSAGGMRGGGRRR